MRHQKLPTPARRGRLIEATLATLAGALLVFFVNWSVPEETPKPTTPAEKIEEEDDISASYNAPLPADPLAPLPQPTTGPGSTVPIGTQRPKTSTPTPKAAPREGDRRLLYAQAATPAPAAPQPDSAIDPSNPLALPQSAGGAPTLADLLSPSVDLSDPSQRARVVAQMQATEQKQKADALAKAQQAGLKPKIVRPDGTVMELMRFQGDQPVYAITHNANAAISTGANQLSAAPYSATGSGVTVGVWDGGAVRSTHQEFGARVTVKDGATLLDHSTHVGGTIAAAGIVAAAKGMAPVANIDSYEWNSDKSEMTARGASYPGEPGTIYLSNHSYGYIAGWTYTGYSSPKWNWYGSGTTAAGTETDFGIYDTNSRDTDSLAASLPYFLMFRSAGNDRADNPVAGDSVSLSTSTSSSSAVTYDPAKHPGGDGSYKSGYDSISFDAVAKNIVTVGAVSDAVANGVRDTSKAAMTYFSSWGPTDDGRIKPDLVANGDELYSALSTSNTAYGTMSGTSMASPNATGTAALLVELYGKLFPGQAMRASTLKGLLINTADDLGTPGPDYQTGWGLINAKAAADALEAFHDQSNAVVVEDRVSTGDTTRSFTFSWDGVSPIRVTLCWTDPAGTATTTSELHTARVLNNLDLTLTDATGEPHQPYVMPYVGTWTAANLSAAAVTGKNNVDNVEQVYLANPGTAGAYTATVTCDGALTNGAQNFSLIITGGIDAARATAPTITSITPDSGSGNGAVLTVKGSGFSLGAKVKLARSGQSDVEGYGLEVVHDAIKGRLNLASAPAGVWDVVVTNPNGKSATLAGAFTVTGSLWAETFEGDVSAWTQGASVGYYSSWTLSSDASHSTTHAVFTSVPQARNVEDLYSPAIAVPAGSSGMRLTFWQYYAFQSGRDGGVLELSLNGGSTWFDVTASGSGASFANGGYNTTLSNSGPAYAVNPLAGRRAWSGSTSGFTQVSIDLTDSAKYAGQTLQLRWRLASDQTFTPGGGWYIDDIALAGTVAAANLAPTIVSAAVATPETVTETTAVLSVEADDDGGEDALTYTWAATGEYYKSVQFSDNGRNSAKTTTATFLKAGTYTLTVSVRDAANLATSSVVEVTVGQTPTKIVVSPARALLGQGTTQQFTAVQLDQFDDAMETQPDLTWSASGGGTIDDDGLFTAGTTLGGPFTITASEPSGGGATATVQVWNPLPAMTGSYRTLILRDGISIGVLTVKVAAGGAVTGKITTAEGSFSFKGTLASSGVFTFSTTSKKLGTISIDLSGTLSGDYAQLQGTVTLNGEALDLSSSARLATAEEAGLAAGRYTFTFSPDNNLAATPQGYGWSVATLNKSGTFLLTGTLADGAKLSLGTGLRLDGTVLVYVAPRKAASGLAGVLGPAAAPAAFAGGLVWEKLATSSGAYALGFTAGVAATGYRYTAPASGSTILEYPVAESAWLTLADGGLREFSEIQLTGSPLEKVFQLSLTSSSLRLLKLNAFTRSNGLFRGALAPVGGTSRAFSGVLLQGANEGRGFFLGAAASGAVQYLPAN